MIRRRKIEYDLVAEKVNTLPSREELEKWAIFFSWFSYKPFCLLARLLQPIYFLEFTVEGELMINPSSGRSRL
jgi:hypothetical protein